jgi:Polyketide cyclase / dehydrase and lipid transport
LRTKGKLLYAVNSIRYVVLHLLVYYLHMALDVTAHIEIKRDSKVVSAYAFEPTNDPIWIGGISQAKLLTQLPVSKGTQVQRRAKFMGRTINYVLEVRTLEPDHLMVMESIKSPFPMNVTYQFDALDTGTTLVKIRVQGTARTFYGLADFLMAPMVKRNLNNDLRRLKAKMESE